jgi:hypothetical protein
MKNFTDQDVDFNREHLVTKIDDKQTLPSIHKLTEVPKKGVDKDLIIKSLLALVGVVVVIKLLS